MDNLVSLIVLGLILWWFYKSGKRAAAAKATTSADRVPAVAAGFPSCQEHRRRAWPRPRPCRPLGRHGRPFFLAIGDDTPFGNAITRSCQPRSLSPYRSSRVCETTPVRKRTRAKPSPATDVDDSAKQLEN